MIESLQALLEFDPVLIGVFAGLSMMTVQMLKSSSEFVTNNPMLINMTLSIFFATMIVFEITWVLGIAILTFLIMSAASGVYSSSKSKTVVELPDYSDES
jgi:hypothetical protein